MSCPRDLLGRSSYSTVTKRPQVDAYKRTRGTFQDQEKLPITHFSDIDFYVNILQIL